MLGLPPCFDETIGLARTSHARGPAARCAPRSSPVGYMREANCFAGGSPALSLRSPPDAENSSTAPTIETPVPRTPRASPDRSPARVGNGTPPLQPYVCRIRLEMPCRARERQRRMSQSKIWIAHDRIRQMLARLLHLCRVAGCAESVPTHELRIGQRIPAVSRALRNRLGCSERPLQRPGNLLRDLTRQAGHPLHIEIAFPSESTHFANTCPPTRPTAASGPSSFEWHHAARTGSRVAPQLRKHPRHSAGLALLRSEAHPRSVALPSRDAIASANPRHSPWSSLSFPRMTRGSTASDVRGQRALPFSRLSNASRSALGYCAPITRTGPMNRYPFPITVSTNRG